MCRRQRCFNDLRSAVCKQPVGVVHQAILMLFRVVFLHNVQLYILRILSILVVGDLVLLLTSLVPFFEIETMRLAHNSGGGLHLSKPLISTPISTGGLLSFAQRFVFISSRHAVDDAPFWRIASA